MTHRHAVLITAYKDFPMLKRLVRRLHGDAVRVFVHIDRKTSFSETEINDLRPFATVLPTRHLIHWGSYSHLQAIVDLMALAVEDPAVSFVHTISGQDFPVHSMSNVEPDKIYMNAVPFEEDNRMIRDRIYYRKLFHRLEGVRWLYRPLNKAAFLAQKALRLRRQRTRAYEHIFKGVVWMSLPADACRFVLRSPLAQQYLQELRTVYVPEEFFFQTVLMNSSFRDQVTNNNRRFTDWRRRNDSFPAILDETDADTILASDALFARKIDSQISGGLADRLEGYCTAKA